METIEVEKCTVCNSSLVDDIENGEIIESGWIENSYNHVANTHDTYRRRTHTDRVGDCHQRSEL